MHALLDFIVGNLSPKENYIEKTKKTEKATKTTAKLQLEKQYMAHAE